MMTLRHSAKADLLSHTLERRANTVARTPQLSRSEKTARIKGLTAEAEKKLNIMRASGRLSNDQYDGSGVAGTLATTGGELGEIYRASGRALALIDSASPAKLIGAILYDSHRFDNWTMTGQTASGEGFHLRLGSHGGDQEVEPGDSAEGFPFSGGKWVEGELILGGRAYGINNRYPDCMEIKRDDAGTPVAVKIRTRASMRELGCETIEDGGAAWRERRAETGSGKEFLLEMEFPLAAGGGDKKFFGAAGIGFRDQNYGFELEGGTVTLTAVDDDDQLSGAPVTHSIDSGFGAWEVGQFTNVPRSPEAAYRYVGGQHLDLDATILRLEQRNPAAVAALCQDLGIEASGADRLAAVLGAISSMNRDMREQTARLIATAVREGAFVTTNARTSAVQFEGKTLNQGAAGRVMSLLTLRRVMDEAGAIDSAGNFASYEKNQLLDPLIRNPQIVEPLAIVSSQDVPLYEDGEQTGMLERRTVILYDHEAGKFGIGFQEVFHDT